MEESKSIQDYMKGIYELSAFQHKVSIKDLAERQGVSSAATSKMVNKMASQKLVKFDRDKGIQIQKKGKESVMKTLRTHRLIEQFLFTVLKYPIEEVHDEAEELEHSVSSRFVEQLDALLRFPKVDPHGDPISVRRQIAKCVSREVDVD